MRKHYSTLAAAAFMAALVMSAQTAQAAPAWPVESSCGGDLTGEWEHVAFYVLGELDGEKMQDTSYYSYVAVDNGEVWEYFADGSYKMTAFAGEQPTTVYPNLEQLEQQYCDNLAAGDFDCEVTKFGCECRSPPSGPENAGAIDGKYVVQGAQLIRDGFTESAFSQIEYCVQDGWLATIHNLPGKADYAVMVKLYRDTSLPSQLFSDFGNTNSPETDPETIPTNPSCGDSVCGEFEDCETCAADCGECQCSVLPYAGPNSNLTISENFTTPRFAKSKISVQVEGTYTSSGLVDGDQCVDEGNGSVGLSVCVELVGSTRCVSGSGAIAKSCTSPLICGANSTQYQCDAQQMCCDSNVSAGLSLSDSVEFKLEMGVLDVTAQASLAIGATYKDSEVKGAGCSDCPWTQSQSLTAHVTATGTATAESMFLDASASVSACMAYTVQRNKGCGTSSLKTPFSGEVKVGPFQIKSGIFSTSIVEKAWTYGGGC